jgi:lipoyl(octanoyl) transferase
LLRVHLLGQIELDAALRLQRSVLHQLRCDRNGAALLLCEHPPLITVGRQGRPADVLLSTEELAARGWPVRWLSRGGGCVLHLPGQLAFYALLPLDQFGLGVGDHMDRLQRVLLDLLNDFGVQGQTRDDRAGVWVHNRLIAAIGIAVRDRITTFGGVFNIDPDLTHFRHVHSGAEGDGPMTSLARERRGPLRPALVRQRLLEHFADRYGFDSTNLFFTSPQQLGHQRLHAPL